MDFIDLCVCRERGKRERERRRRRRESQGTVYCLTLFNWLVLEITRFATSLPTSWSEPISSRILQTFSSLLRSSNEFNNYVYNYISLQTPYITLFLYAYRFLSHGPHFVFGLLHICVCDIKILSIYL